MAVIRRRRRRSLNWKGDAVVECAGTLGARSFKKPSVGETMGGAQNGVEVRIELRAPWLERLRCPGGCRFVHALCLELFHRRDYNRDRERRDGPKVVSTVQMERVPYVEQ
jgi:hypothetical protein